MDGFLFLSGISTSTLKLLFVENEQNMRGIAEDFTKAPKLIALFKGINVEEKLGIQF